MATSRRGQRNFQRKPSAKQNREAPKSIEAAEVTIEIEELATFRESINILVYGPSGHGKTALVGGTPNATFLSTEKGAVTAKITGSTAKLMRAPDWEHVIAGKRKADEKLGKDDWLILDSLTKMQVLMIRWILRMANEDNSSRDLDIPAIQDHQKWQNYFKRFVDSLIDAEYNTIFVCTDMIKTDQDGDDIVLPHIEGKDYSICNYVRGQTDVNIYYAVTDKTEDGSLTHRALFQPVPPYIAAKDRYSALGRYQDVADGDFKAMAHFIALIEEAERLSTERLSISAPTRRVRRS